MGANKLGGWQGGGVVLAYGDPKLLLLTVRHQPGLVDPLGGDILQLWNPCPDVLTIQIIVLHRTMLKASEIHRWRTCTDGWQWLGV